MGSVAARWPLRRLRRDRDRAGIFASLNRTAKAPLEKALAAFLKGGSAQDFIQALAGMQGIEARVLQAGMDAAAEGGADAAEEAIAGTILFEAHAPRAGPHHRRHGRANAPFIGLFGTVLGIIRAFHELGQSAADAGAAVMSGISEALVATAVGLMVAIPAVVLYNTFQRRNKDLLARVESIAHLVLARVKSVPADDDARRSKRAGPTASAESDVASRLGGGDDDAITDINITPFVDIILVVLIIFMVTTTYIVKQGIKVNLPDAATGEATESTSLGVSLATDGTLYLDGEPITEDALRARIRAEHAKKSDVVCLIAADRDVRHGEVVRLIDLVKQEGVAKFAINIDPEALPPEAAGAVPAPVVPQAATP
jgi:biopolymer transport protein ExbD